jgi:diguanylate cyclase (GGDEF)-like protein
VAPVSAQVGLRTVDLSDVRAAILVRATGRVVRFPPDVVGRLRWCLVYWAMFTAVTSVTVAAPSRGVSGHTALGVALLGLLLAGRHALAYWERSYRGVGDVAELAIMITLGLTVGSLACTGVLLAGMLARGTLERPRRLPVPLAAYAVVTLAGNVVDERHGNIRPLPDVLGQIGAMIMLAGLVCALVHTLKQQEALERYLAYHARHDSLTGLPNRSVILDRADQMLSRSANTGLPVAALFIDLDGFKDVNDLLGHPVGDRLLTAAAARMSTAVRDQDSLGRLGGDEFVVLVDDSPDDMAEGIAQRLLEVLREPFDIDGYRLSVTGSIGLAVAVGITGADLLRDADIALYQAKAAGKDCAVRFEPAMQEELERRLAG